MTLSKMTLSKMTLSKMIISKMTLSKMTLSKTTPSKMTPRKMTLSIMTLSIMTLSIMTLSKMTLIIMIHSKMTLTIMTLIIMALSTMTLNTDWPYPECHYAERCDVQSQNAHKIFINEKLWKKIAKNYDDEVWKKKKNMLRHFIYWSWNKGQQQKNKMPVFLNSVATTL
jgi:hypothetical protein